MSDASVPWSTMFNHCRAHTGDIGSDRGRCDLKRNHEGYPHILERGMYNIQWYVDVTVSSPL